MSGRCGTHGGRKKYFGGKPEGKIQVQDLSLNMRIILKYNLKKWNESTWVRLI
jgi:hypothetical protein